MTSSPVRYAQAHDVPFEKLGWPRKRFRAMELVGEPMDIYFTRYDRSTQAVRGTKAQRKPASDNLCSPAFFVPLCLCGYCHTPRRRCERLSEETRA